FAEPFEVAFAARVDGRRRMTGPHDLLAGPRRPLRTDVADGRDAAPGNPQEILDVPPALQADADHADSDHLDGRCGIQSRVLRRVETGGDTRSRRAGDNDGAAGLQEVTAMNA